MNRRSRPTCLVWAVCALTLSFSAPPVRAQIAPLPPDQPAYGLTRAQWLEAFVQWFGSIPLSSNPWTDSDGTDAGLGQHGPVWFLAGAFRGIPVDPRPNDVSRTVTVPEGKAILTVGVLGTVGAVPGAMTDASLLKRAAAFWPPAVTRLEMSMDGVPVGDPLSYWVQTDVFSIDVVPTDNYWQLPRAGGLHPTGKDNRLTFAASAIVLLFPPLPVGTHVFSFLAEGIDNGQPWKATRTITIQVQKPNAPLP